MGQWNISIDGHGCHHNDNPEIDANEAVKEFLKTLKQQGHDITRAEFRLAQEPESLLEESSAE